jgi:amino acid transporter
MIVMINFFGVKGYGEAEFVFSVVKVTAVIGYMYERYFPIFLAQVDADNKNSILGVLMNIMGGFNELGPDGSYMGFRLWNDPGAFNNGFKGLCSTFVTAAFAFAGTELVGLAAAETENPRKALPTAIKQVSSAWLISTYED